MTSIETPSTLQKSPAIEADSVSFSGLHPVTERRRSVDESKKPGNLTERRQSLDESKKPGNLRRKSTLKGISRSLVMAFSFRRLTRASLSQNELPTPKMENTYRMEPKEKSVFKPDKLQRPIYAIVEDYLKNQKYDRETCNQLSCYLSQAVNTKVKEYRFERYKFVSNVILGQVKDQGLQMVSRCIWDSNKDGYLTISYKNDSLFAVVTIHGVYFE